MRQDLLVYVPLEDSGESLVSYSMYAYGVKKEKTILSKEGKFLSMKLDGNSISVFFYYFFGFKRAYVVTGWDQNSGEVRSILPGVEGDLSILFTAVGRDFRALRQVIKFLTKYSEEGVFKLPFSFWYRVCALIQGRNAGKCNVLHLLHMTKEELEFYGKNDLCTQVSV